MAAGPLDGARATGETEPQRSTPGTGPRGGQADELARGRRRRTGDFGAPVPGFRAPRADWGTLGPGSASHATVLPGAADGTDDRPADLPARLMIAPEVLVSERDEAAELRDYEALRRDHDADTRDRVMSGRELSDALYDGVHARDDAEIVVSAAAIAARASAHRADSVRLRELAAADRAAAASDRLLAARDRARALAERAALLCELESSRRETLAWARSQEPGLNDIEYELRRCRRVARSLVVACIDILAPAGQLSSAQAEEQERYTIVRIREHLRARDLLIACSADRYVCAMPAVSLTAARQRIAGIQRTLADDPDARPIRAGVAQPRADEVAADAIARAGTLILGARDQR